MCIFGCVLYVLIVPHKRTKMRPQHCLGVHVGFDTPSIIRYLEPLIKDVFTAHFADCHFSENSFSPLKEKKMPLEIGHELSWNVFSLLHFDPDTSQNKNKVRRITLQDMLISYQMSLMARQK